MHSRKCILYIVLFSFISFGCGKQIPKGIITPDKMEDILYDYHLASTLGEELPYDQNYKKELYNKYVFKKYGITSAEFDSSMVWYSTHSEELSQIYKNIDKRFTDNRNRYKALALNKPALAKKTFSGDSVDIWNDNTLYWLTYSDATNKKKFEVTADTAFKQTDIFILNGDYIFIEKGKQDAVMAMQIILNNDSVVAKSKEITKSGNYSLKLNLDKTDFTIRSIKGFIYYKGNSKLPGLLVNNLSLMKVHDIKAEKDSTSIKNDSLKSSNKDSADLKPIKDVNKDTLMEVRPIRKDPRSIRDRRMPNRKIK